MNNCIIFGATGWLGSTTLAYLNDKYPDSKLTLISSEKKIGSIISYTENEKNIFNYS